MFCHAFHAPVRVFETRFASTSGLDGWAARGCTRLDTWKCVGILRIVRILSKSAPIESLGLSQGVHRLKVVVADDTVSFEVED